MPDTPKLRVARACRDFARMRKFYCDGLGFTVLGSFEDHEGYDGMMLGHPRASWHLEFTRHAEHDNAPKPHGESLLVLYLPDPTQWEAAILRMNTAGFTSSPAENDYWNRNGALFVDPDGFGVVLAHMNWTALPC